MRLVIRLFIGVVVGLLCGELGNTVLIQALITLERAIGDFIHFLIPLIVLFFITSGIAQLEAKAFALLATTVFLSYVSSIVAGLFAAQAVLSFPHLYAGAHYQWMTDAAAVPMPWFELDIPQVMHLSTALLCAFMLGIGIQVTRARHLADMITEGRIIIEWVIHHCLLPILPLFIAGVFTKMAASGTVWHTMLSLGRVLCLAVSLHWLWLIALYVLTGLVLGGNPLRWLRNMLPAYFTAVSTLSSAATIPVALEQTKKNLERPAIADFTVPLCANIHLCGSMITLVVSTVAVMALSPNLAMPTLLQLLPFLFALGIIMIAAPGVPGGGVMSAIGLLTSFLGFDQSAIAMMIALYVAQDSFGTACNVTGDGAIALLVERLAQQKA